MNVCHWQQHLFPVCLCVGVYQHVAGAYVGRHAVKLLGWGSENGTHYWILANSWNTHWGEDGEVVFCKGKRSTYCCLSVQVSLGCSVVKMSKELKMAYMEEFQNRTSHRMSKFRATFFFCLINFRCQKRTLPMNFHLTKTVIRR